jgi:hypothetical protein
VCAKFLIRGCTLRLYLQVTTTLAHFPGIFLYRATENVKTYGIDFYCLAQLSQSDWLRSRRPSFDSRYGHFFYANICPIPGLDISSRHEMKGCVRIYAVANNTPTKRAWSVRPNAVFPLSSKENQTFLPEIESMDSQPVPTLQSTVPTE